MSLQGSDDEGVDLAGIADEELARAGDGSFSAAKLSRGNAASVKSLKGKKRLPPHVSTSTDTHYDDETWECIRAVDDYRRLTGHKFPTISEYLQIMKSIGYVKQKSKE